jgi:hypothetical protein
MKNASGQEFTVCFNAFQPFSSNAGGGQLDYILGDAFVRSFFRPCRICFFLLTSYGAQLRNVYSLYDFGDFVEGISGYTQGDPYIKLLPLTDPTAASAEFKAARAAQLNAAGMPPQLDPTAVNGPPKGFSGTKAGTNNANRLTWNWVTASIAGVIVILLV